ncbi:MAG: type II secretion system F family protein, partial [Candidatus Desulforudis sp.]|nr:type II secretion system F family protein [Desulforudis sp.]
MPGVYAYRVRDRRGQLVTGVLEAEGEAAAVASLRARDYFVIELKETSTRAGAPALAYLLRKRVRSRDLALFCRQFAALIDAGVPILQGLRILTAQAANKRLKAALAEVGTDIEQGSSLAEAFRRRADVFPPVFTSLIEAGELGGQLDAVLLRLALHFEKEHAVREKTVSALTYPVIVLVIAMLAVAVLVTFVLPTFVGILEQMGVPLPRLTRMIINASLWANRYWYLVFGGLAAAVIGGRHLLDSPAGREYRDRAVLRMPIFGDLVRKIIIARFCRTFAGLARSGVPILQALEVIKKTAGNVVVARAVEKTAASVGEGGAIAGLLEQSRVFPPMVTQMIAVGEETGALDTLLEKLAAFYEQEVE